MHAERSGKTNMKYVDVFFGSGLSCLHLGDVEGRV